MPRITEQPTTDRTEGKVLQDGGQSASDRLAALALQVVGGGAPTGMTLSQLAQPTTVICHRSVNFDKL